jgi:folylpolyglutamate synthase/dihydropteroate synthase
MAAIEACYALRRDGVRLPGQAMMAGLQKAEVPVCFDVVTERPGVVVSAASTQEDVRALLAALHQKTNSFGGRIVLCVSHVPDKLLAAFDKEFGAQQDFAVQEVIFVGQNAPQPEGVALTACTTPKRAAKRILSLTEPDTTTLVVGDTKFAFAIKEAVTDALIGLS